MLWTGLIWLGIISRGQLLATSWISFFYKILGTSWAAADLVLSQGVGLLCSVDLVPLLINRFKPISSEIKCVHEQNPFFKRILRYGFINTERELNFCDHIFNFFSFLLHILISRPKLMKKLTEPTPSSEYQHLLHWMVKKLRYFLSLKTCRHSSLDRQKLSTGEFSAWFPLYTDTHTHSTHTQK
jgi:hypothetical protein